MRNPTSVDGAKLRLALPYTQRSKYLYAGGRAPLPRMIALPNEVLGLVLDFLCPLENTAVAGVVELAARLDLELDEDGAEDQERETVELWLESAHENERDMYSAARALASRVRKAAGLLEVSKTWSGALLAPLKRREHPRGNQRNIGSPSSTRVRNKPLSHRPTLSENKDDRTSGNARWLEYRQHEKHCSRVVSRLEAMLPYDSEDEAHHW